MEPVFEHYALVGKVCEGIRALAELPRCEASDGARRQWIELCKDASSGVSNSATESLKSLGLPLEPS